MKREHQSSEYFATDDGRFGILVELVDNKVVHINLMRKGSGGNIELNEAQIEWLAEIIPPVSQFVRSLKTPPSAQIRV